LKSGKLAMARPCKDCGEILKQLNFRYVYYSNNDGKIIREKIKQKKYTHKSTLTKFMESKY